MGLTYIRLQTGPTRPEGVFIIKDTIKSAGEGGGRAALGYVTAWRVLCRTRRAVTKCSETGGYGNGACRRLYCRPAARPLCRWGAGDTSRYSELQIESHKGIEYRSMSVSQRTSRVLEATWPGRTLDITQCDCQGISF